MDGVNRDELKRVGFMLLICLPLFVLMFVGFMHSPMYQTAREQEREATQLTIATNYYMLDPSVRQELMTKYGFTEDEVDILKLMGKNSGRRKN